jgi:hypothetical protein
MLRISLLLQICLLFRFIGYADDIFLKSGFVYRNLRIVDTTGHMLRVASENDTFSLPLEAVMMIEKHEVISNSKVVYEMYSQEIFKEFQGKQQETRKPKEEYKATQSEEHPTKHFNIAVGYGHQLLPEGANSTTRVKLWYQTGIHILSIRYLRGGSNSSGTPSGVLSFYQLSPVERFIDIAVMYGVGTELYGVSANVTVGISDVRGTSDWTYLGMSSGILRLPIYKPNTFSDIIGFPIEAELASNGWFTYFGGSVSFFADFNSKASFDGILFSLQANLPLH